MIMMSRRTKNSSIVSFNRVRSKNRGWCATALFYNQRGYMIHGGLENLYFLEVPKVSRSRQLFKRPFKVNFINV